MTDEADAPLVEGNPDSRAEWHQYASGCVVFPVGVEAFAAETGALAIRIADKTGDIEILEEVGKPWRDASKANRPAAIAAVK